jgi:hypothetical protein
MRRCFRIEREVKTHQEKALFSAARRSYFQTNNYYNLLTRIGTPIPSSISLSKQLLGSIVNSIKLSIQEVRGVYMSEVKKLRSKKKVLFMKTACTGTSKAQVTGSKAGFTTPVGDRRMIKLDPCES